MFSFVRKASKNGDSKTLFHFLEFRFISTKSTNPKSFIVSYLVESCGLSEPKAISASNKVKFKTSDNPNSVLALLRDNGFPHNNISKMVERMPLLLTYKVDQTLKPKLDFFKSEGLSGPNLFKSITAYPFVLRVSLKKVIIPSLDLLKTILQTKTKVVQLLKQKLELVSVNPQRRLLPNITLLRAYGVSDSNIAYLLLNQSRALLKMPAPFAEMVEEIKKMGFNPSQCLFAIAIKGLTSMSRSTLAAKFDVYRRWGWSVETIQYAFRRQPYCMIASEKKIMATMKYLVTDMGYSSLLIAKQPGLLTYSLEKRILPRCSVIHVLMTNGLIEKSRGLTYLMNRSEKDFLKNFVVKFEDRVPDLLNIYQGKGKVKLHTPA